MSDELVLSEFLEQIDYCLSLKFKEKWRYRFSTHFIEVFQEKVLNAVKTERPLKLSSLVSTYTKKFKYSPSEVREFFLLICIEDYYPLVYEDKKFIAQKRDLFTS
tara:strand:- start:70 stop:384 length:315 start_codon:yes stop_codon:yes gene_type:complete